MIGLSGLGQAALGAFPPSPAAPVAFFRSLSWHAPYGLIGIRITSARGGDVRTGVKGYSKVPIDCTIVGAMVFGDKVGSITFDIYRAPAGAPFPPTPDNTICFDRRPALSGTQFYIDRTLLDWDTALAKGDTLAAVVVSCAGIANVTLGLLVDHL